MSPQSFSNYIRRERRKAQLTQDELAYLLGSRKTGGARVSRYERFARRPSLEVVLACEFIFSVKATALVAGTFQNLKLAVARRAAILAAEIAARPRDARRDRKVAILRALADAQARDAS